VPSDSDRAHSPPASTSKLYENGMHMGGHEYQLQVPVGQSPQQTTQQYTQDSRNLMPNGDSAAEAIGASTHKQLGAAAAASP
jgi:hypothetical protein